MRSRHTRTLAAAAFLALTLAVAASGSGPLRTWASPELIRTRECLTQAGIETQLLGKGTPEETRILTAHFPLTSAVVIFGYSAEGAAETAAYVREEGYSPIIRGNIVYWPAIAHRRDELGTLEACLP